MKLGMTVILEKEKSQKKGRKGSRLIIHVLYKGLKGATSVPTCDHVTLSRHIRNHIRWHIKTHWLVVKIISDSTGMLITGS